MQIVGLCSCVLCLLSWQIDNLRLSFVAIKMASRAFFAGSPVVRTLHFMAEGAGSVPGGELRSFMLVMWPKSHRLPRADWVPTFEKVVCRTPVDQRCLHHLGAFLAHTDLGSFRPHHLSCSPWSLLLAALPAQKALSVCLYSTEPYLPPSPLYLSAQAPSRDPPSP